jgi:DNA polymerase-3 subunit alpha
LTLGDEVHIPLVATSDCHYFNRSDARAHEALLCIQTGKTMSDPNRMRFTTDEFYFKSPQEMHSAFEFHPEALANTVKIAERCNLKLKFDEYHLPQYVVPNGYTRESYLEELAKAGLEKRLKDISGDHTPYRERLATELKIIESMGFPGYFLVVWDFIRYAKEQKIPVGPGRGSAAGSIVAYSLEITDINPLPYDLLFERFLNPERISMPDIDIDFCMDRRTV